MKTTRKWKFIIQDAKRETVRERKLALAIAKQQFKAQYLKNRRMIVDRELTECRDSVYNFYYNINKG